MIKTATTIRHKREDLDQIVALQDALGGANRYTVVAALIRAGLEHIARDPERLKPYVGRHVVDAERVNGFEPRASRYL